MDIEESKKAIIRTVIYADIFDYPLTTSQLHTFLITKKPVPEVSLQKALSQIQQITQKDGYICLQGRESLIEKRKKKQEDSQQKIKRAEKIAGVLSAIPSVLFIGISGGVSMLNAQRDDDIDLFIITRKNTVWGTRLLILLLLRGLGVLRTRKMKKVSDKFCVNMLISEDALVFPPEKQNLFIAHEIAQLAPLIQRNKTYQRFYKANTWIATFLPHVFLEEKSVRVISDTVFHRIFLFLITRQWFEKFTAWGQKIYMHQVLTNETISDNFLAFHPFDYAKYTLSIYNKRIHEKV